MVRRRPLVSPSASSPAVAAVMRANKKHDSGPELIVRRLLHSLGYRYRLHARDLPGNPDIVFRSLHKVILVHGCFWHQHQSAWCPLQLTQGQICTIGNRSCVEIGSGIASMSKR